MKRKTNKRNKTNKTNKRNKNKQNNQNNQNNQVNNQLFFDFESYLAEEEMKAIHELMIELLIASEKKTQEEQAKQAVHA